ncbi:MAG TPA: hypothetical protein VH158_01925 [Gemmatimonadales bacterium]|nr:hypothetical protein [Gemmatimonadales bacterium]
MAGPLSWPAPRRLAAAVAGLAVVVYGGAIANGFAWDDVPIIVDSALVHHVSGLWRAYAAPSWPPAAGGYLHRPLTVATYPLDWLVAPGHAWWFHGVNLLWHAAASVTLALLARGPASGADSLLRHRAALEAARPRPAGKR